MLNTFFSMQQERLRRIPSYKRYLYNTINDEALTQRANGILGSRGVGKTTLMLQIIKERYGLSDKALYISVDHPYFEDNPLYEFAENFYKYGGELLCIDEVHKYPDWSSHIKAIYDGLSGLKVIFSGSSILRMAKQKGDLSRRALIYHLGGLSFREYLNLMRGYSFSAYSLEEILKGHISIASNVISEISSAIENEGKRCSSRSEPRHESRRKSDVLNVNAVKILPAFKEYIEKGYYPFILEGEEFYRQKIIEILNHTLETDIPFAASISIRQISKLKKLLYLLAKSVPFIPDITELARSSDISRPMIYDYLGKLKDGKIILLLQKVGRGYEILSKPEKLYLENTNLISALSLTPEIGTIRETFFANQIINAYANDIRLSSGLSGSELIAIPNRGDFFINGKWTFEVGGKSKKEKQISGISDSYILADDIETGYGKRIPLWLIGFLY